MYDYGSKEENEKHYGQVKVNYMCIIVTSVRKLHGWINGNYSKKLREHSFFGSGDLGNAGGGSLPDNTLWECLAFFTLLQRC
jgi:hypothetical protein